MVRCSGWIRLNHKSLLVLLTTLDFIIYLDRGAFASIVYLLKDDDKGLGLSSTETGAAASIFMFGFMIMCPIFAYLA